MPLPAFDIGDGLSIRPLVLEDDEELFALVDANRDHLHPWMIWEPATTEVEHTREFIRRNLEAYEGNAIVAEGRIVGVIGLSVEELGNSGEIGYWIDAGHEGRGIVTRACRAIFEHAFAEMGLHRMALGAAPENARSRAIAERLGMVEEATLRDDIRVPDGYQDKVVYGLLEEEWRAQR